MIDVIFRRVLILARLALLKVLEPDDLLARWAEYDAILKQNAAR